MQGFSLSHAMLRPLLDHHHQVQPTYLAPPMVRHVPIVPQMNTLCCGSAHVSQLAATPFRGRLLQVYAMGTLSLPLHAPHAWRATLFCTGLPTAEGAVAWLLNTPLASVNGGGIRASWMMFTKPATFQDASQQCYLAGGDLVMPIWGAEENTAAVKWAAKWVSSPMWLGLRAPTPTKNLKDWKWVAQAGAQSQISSPMYNAWAHGYPSGTFAYAQVDPNAQWKDVDENTKLPYICELPITDFKL